MDRRAAPCPARSTPRRAHNRARMSDVRFTRTIGKAHLARVKAAREQADAAYNAALSAPDAALPGARTMPHASAAPDETQVTPLNEQFDVAGALQLPGGLKGRLLRPVW